MATVEPLSPPQPAETDSEEESHYSRVNPPSDELRYTLDCYEPSQALSLPEHFPSDSQYATITQGYSSGYVTCSSDQRTLQRQSQATKHAARGAVGMIDYGDREMEEGARGRSAASLRRSVDVPRANSHKLENGIAIHSQPADHFERGDLQSSVHESQPFRFRSRPLLAIMRQLENLNPALCNLLKEADSHLHRGQLEKAGKCLENSLQQSNEYPRLQSLVWLLLGIIHTHLRQYKKASVCYLRYLAFCREMQDFLGMTRAECKLGITYMKQGLLKLAGRCFKQYLENSQILQDDVGVAAACSNLGIVSKMLGIQSYKAALREGELRQAMSDLATNLYRAVTYFEQHLDIMEHYGDLEKQACAYGNLGGCYELLKQHTQAIYCHNKRLEIVRILGDKVSESCVLCHLGNCFRTTGKLQEAMEYYHLGYELAQVTGSHKVEMVALLNLGATCELCNKLDKAVEWHTLYLSMAVRYNDLQGQARALSTMAGLYEEMRQLKKSELYYNKLADVFKKLGDNDGRLSATRYLQMMRRSEKSKRNSSEQSTHSKVSRSLSHLPAHSHASLHVNIERSTSKRSKMGTWLNSTQQQHTRGPRAHTAGSFSSSCRVVFENPAREFLQEQYKHQEEMASEIAEQAYLSSHANLTPSRVSPDSTLCFPYTYHSQQLYTSDEEEEDPRHTLVRRMHMKRHPSSAVDPPPLPPRRYSQSELSIDADTESTAGYESLPDNVQTRPLNRVHSSGTSYPSLRDTSESQCTLSVCSTCSSQVWESVELSDFESGSVGSEVEVDKEWEQWLSMRDMDALSRVASMSKGQIGERRSRLAKLKPTHSAPHIAPHIDYSLDTGEQESSS